MPDARRDCRDSTFAIEHKEFFPVFSSADFSQENKKESHHPAILTVSARVFSLRDEGVARRLTTSLLSRGICFLGRYLTLRHSTRKESTVPELFKSILAVRGIIENCRYNRDVSPENRTIVRVSCATTVSINNGSSVML